MKSNGSNKFHIESVEREDTTHLCTISEVPDVINDFLKIVSENNVFQEKYIKQSMSDITSNEITYLERLFNFYMSEGYSVRSIAEKYLSFIEHIFIEQLYFKKNGKYRFKNFGEVEKIYNDKSYMESYLVALGLSTYLWDIHRLLRRFFIRNIIKAKSANTYLEIGPGHGEYLVTAMENSDFQKYVAIDISQTAVEITKKFVSYSQIGKNKNFNILQKDFFSYNDTNFDAVIMGEVLEHVENPLIFLNKIYDITNSDSFIYISTAINAPQPDHIYLFNNIDEIFELVKQSHFEIIDYITLTNGNIPIEKALQKKMVITVGACLKRL